MTKIKCKKCLEVLEGDGKGTFKQCKCKSCYIDETKWYCRVGGNPQDIEFIEEKGEQTDDKERNIPEN